MHNRLRRVLVNVETDASGDFTTTTQKLNGTLIKLEHTQTDLAATADHTITTAVGGETVFSLSNWASTDGTLYVQTTKRTNTAGFGATQTPIVLCDEGLTVTVAQGGANKSSVWAIVYQPHG